MFRYRGQRKRFDPTADLSGVPQDVPAGYDNIQPSGFIEDGVIDVAAFASTIRPVQLVDSLPALPDSEYPVGSVVYLTTDGKLYRNVADSWTAAVGSAEGGVEPVAALPTLPDADYPVGSVVYLTTDGKLYRNVADAWTKAVDGGDITASTITGDKILAGEIETSHMAANSIDGDRITAGTLDAAKIVANSIEAGQIAAGAIATDELAANAVTAAKIAANEITAEKLKIGSNGNLIRNPSFEDGDASVLDAYVVVGTTDDETLLRGWQAQDGTMEVNHLTSGNARTGTRIGAFRTTALNSRLWQLIPVLSNRTYRLGGLHWKGSAGGVTSRLRANTVDAAGATVSFNVMFADTTSGSPVREEMTYTIPASGVSYLRIELLANGTPGGTEVFAWEDLQLELLSDNLVNSAAEVTIDSGGITVINGAVTVASDSGSTVVIDGTSQMFKIQATGTQTRAFPAAGNVATASTTISGTDATPQAALFQTSYTNASSALRTTGTAILSTLGAGGGHMDSRSTSYVDISASDNRINLTAESALVNPGTTATHRYYLLKEAGI
jgi:hypothetical protein